jgi:hypothetical protein
MTTMTQSTALEIATLAAGIKKAEASLVEAKVRLIELVGDEGETFTTGIGKVSVTKRTFDRPTGMFSFALDSTVFARLDESIQANLVKQGVVRKEEKITRGQAPVVKVTLS